VRELMHNDPSKVESDLPAPSISTWPSPTGIAPPACRVPPRTRRCARLWRYLRTPRRLTRNYRGTSRQVSPCLPGKTGRDTRCRLVSFELEPRRYVPLPVGSIRRNCGRKLRATVRKAAHYHRARSRRPLSAGGHRSGPLHESAACRHPVQVPLPTGRTHSNE
jgi:hypothetical protein